VTGRNAWCEHSPHFTLGFWQSGRFHSFEQNGAQPFVPFLSFVQKRG
jgi:hypothetical protein